MLLVRFLLQSWNILKLMNLVHAYSRCALLFVYFNSFYLLQVVALLGEPAS